MAEICQGSPGGGSLSDGGPDPRRPLGARMPSHQLGAAGGGEAGPTPWGLGGLPGLTPELGRVAAAWAARHATKRS